MKSKILKKIASFVTAVTMAMGTIAVLPKVALPESEIVVSAETTDFTNMPAGDYVYATLKNGDLTISGIGDMWNYPMEVDMAYPNYYGYVSAGAAQPSVYRNNVKSITIGDNVTSIGDYAFAGMKNVTTISLPKGITRIGQGSFGSCTELSTINIPNTVKEISSMAFSECTSLTTVTIPKTVESIGTGAFVACGSDFIINCYKGSEAEQYAKEENINYVLLDAGISDNKCGDNAYWSINNGVLKISGTGKMSDYNSTMAPWYSQRKLINSVIVDEGITSIGKDAFFYCSSISSVSLPSTLTTIGISSFNNCNSMVNIDIPDSVSTIGSLAFDSCINLVKATIHNTSVNISSDTFYNCPSLVIYGYKNSTAETYANENNIPFIALDSTVDFSSATMTQYTESVNVGDELLFNVVIRDSNGNPVNVSDLSGELTYTTTVSDSSCIRIDSELTDLTGAVIKATAIGEGTATVTVTFANGVTASSTVTVSDEGNDHNTSDYDKVTISSKPEKFNITYDALTGAVSLEEQDFTITLSYIDLSAVIDGVDKSVEIGAIEVTAPEECILIPEGNTTGTSNSYLKVIDTVLSTNGDSHIMSFKLKAPNADYFATHKNVSDKLVVKLYNSNSSVVKTAEFGVNFKVINDDIPEGTIFIDEDVNGDLVVEDGQTVIIRSNVSCDRLIVKGGECTIPKGITLTVKSDTIVKGGSKPILGIIGDSTQGGKLIVNGRLETKNLTISECGIFEMFSADSYVKVSNKFDISSDGNHTFSDGVLEINREFIAKNDCFKATGNHLTIFDGTGVKISVNSLTTFSYFNNLGFTEKTACDYDFKGTIKTRNIVGTFYLYSFVKNKWVPNKNEDLKWLCEDYESVEIDESVTDIKKTLIDLYKDNKKSNEYSDLKPYLSEETYMRVTADILTYCSIEGIKKNNNLGVLFGIDGLEMGISTDRIVLQYPNLNLSKKFSNKEKGTLYVEIESLTATILDSGAKKITVNWFVVPDSNKKIAIRNKDTHLWAYGDISTLCNDLTKFYSKFTVDTAAKVTKELLKEFGINDKGTDIAIELTKKISKACIDGNFDEFNVTKWTEDDWTKKIFETIIEAPSDFDEVIKVIHAECPVDVKIIDSNNNVVGLVENNTVKISTDKVEMSVVNGDEKICKIKYADDYTIKLLGTADGTMDYKVTEYSNNVKIREVSFYDLPLTTNTIYNGNVFDVILQNTESYALVDESHNIHYADSDDLIIHEHFYSSTWKYDSKYHWHECSCGEKNDIANHTPDSGKITVQPTATTTGVKIYSCTVCGYVLRTETIPATGVNGYPSYPTYPTYPTYTITPSVFSEKLIGKAEIKGNTVTLKWDEIKNADKYIVYQYKNGKYVKVKTTANTSVTFKKLKNGETYKFLVRYTINGKLSPTTYSCKYTIKVYYKPITKATAAQNSVKLTWKTVPRAKKYAIYKYVDGKAVKLTEVKGTSVKINKLSSNTKYKYIVRAYVDGKWTTMTKSDIITIKTKAE